MKKYLQIIGFLMMMSLLVACSSGNSTGNKATIDLEAVFDDIKEKVTEDYGGETAGLITANILEPEDDPLIQMTVEELDIKEDQLEAGYMIASAMNVNADTILLFEVKDKTDTDDMKEKLKAYQEMQNNVWESYLPDQHEKVKNTVIETKGNYLIYITYEEPEEIEAIFNDAF